MGLFVTQAQTVNKDLTYSHTFRFKIMNFIFPEMWLFPKITLIMKTIIMLQGGKIGLLLPQGYKIYNSHFLII